MRKGAKPVPVNTKQVIFDAFMALSREKSVDKITVKDLVETCHISRQTFYYHFQDIVEVIEWAFEQALEEALSRRGIALRTGLHCAPLAHESAGTLETGTLRASFSLFNREEEVEAFLAAVEEACGGKS